MLVHQRVTPYFTNQHNVDMLHGSIFSRRLSWRLLKLQIGTAIPVAKVQLLLIVHERKKSTKYSYGRWPIVDGYDWLFQWDYTFHKWGHLVFIIVFRAITVAFGTTWPAGKSTHWWLDHENEHHVYKISITMFDDRRIISIDHHSSPFITIIHHDWPFNIDVPIKTSIYPLVI